MGGIFLACSFHSLKASSFFSWSVPDWDGIHHSGIQNCTFWQPVLQCNLALSLQLIYTAFPSVWSWAFSLTSLLACSFHGWNFTAAGLLCSILCISGYVWVLQLLLAEKARLAAGGPAASPPPGTTNKGRNLRKQLVGSVKLICA